VGGCGEGAGSVEGDLTAGAGCGSKQKLAARVRRNSARSLGVELRGLPCSQSKHRVGFGDLENGNME
jgi:hypothetical protein